MRATDVVPPDEIVASTGQLLDSAPDAVVIIDATGVIRLVNHQAEAMFGYTREEFLGSPIELLVVERNQPDVDGRRAEYYRNPRAIAMGDALDIAVRRKDGTEFPVDVAFSLLETDNGRCVSAAIRDSSDRRALESRLQSFAVTSQLAAIVESSVDAMYTKTLDGVVTTWNAGAEALFGYSAADIVGRDVSQIIPADRLDEQPLILDRVRRGERVDYYDTKRRRKDGSSVDVSVGISPIRDAAGVVTGASVVARDLTEAMQGEADRRVLEAQLHQAQRLESLGQLAGGVAHDFNNLLAAIMNYTSLVSENLQSISRRTPSAEDDALSAAQRDLGEITSVARRAAALTRHLLIFSRRDVVQPEVLDLNEVLGDLEDLLRRTIGENVDDLRTLFAADLPLVKADRGQLDQLVMNLSVNARDAMPSGGTLTIETASVEIDSDYARRRGLAPGTYVRLELSDTGTGMRQEVADRAFEPFFTTKAVGKGTGLGLATVYGIVMQAGGDVSIRSQLGSGTTVRVDLPATSEVRTEVSEERMAVLRPARGETVLLVEDEDLVREPTRRILARHGYTVLAARDASQALELVHDHVGSIDLLLTDVIMPGRSGKELSVEAVEVRPSMRVLFMSGYSNDVIVHQGILDDRVNLIGKPFAAEDLLGRVRKVLDGSA